MRRSSDRATRARRRARRRSGRAGVLGSRRATRPRGRRRALLVLSVTGVVLAAALAVSLVADALLVRAALEDAERAVTQARTQLAGGEVAAARDRLVDARGELERATARTNRLLWRTAERLPVAGATFTTLDGVVAVIDRGSGIGAALVGALAPLLGPDGELLVQPDDGRFPVEVLEAAGDAADALDTTALRRALAELRAVDGPVPAPVAEGRDRVLAVAEDAARTLEAAAPVASQVPVLLGADGPRRYLLGMQNPAELRGTGGLLGFTAELTVDDGRLTITRPESYSALDALGREADGDLPAVATPAAFAARYADQNAAGFLANVNVDPHLPTTGPVLLDLVEDRTGRRFDGLILVDPVAVAHVLAPIGPVTVSAEVAATAPGLPSTVPADRFADLVMIEHYAAFEGRNEQRRDWLSDVATGAFTRIVDGRWDGAAVTRAVLEAAGSGHLALHVRDPDQQAAFLAAGLAGALAPPPGTSGDVLAVTANNSAGNKLDRHVTHRVGGTVTLAGDPATGELERTAQLEAAVSNPITPGQLSLYVEGSFPPSRGSRTPRSEDRGLARTWWSFWGPELDELVVAGPDGPRTGSWAIHGQRVADVTVETPPGTTSAASAIVRGRVALEPVAGAWRYRLHLPRQPKAIADELALAIEPPEGWRFHGGTVRGGDAAVGVTGTGPALDLAGGAAQLTGAITSDLEVELVLVPA